MKGALVGLFVAIILIIMLSFKANFYFNKLSIDVQIHDTYFVFGFIWFIILLLTFLGTFFSIGGLINSVFKSKLFWGLTIFFLFIDIIYFKNLFKILF